jgi:hypothetical protein
MSGAPAKDDTIGTWSHRYNKKTPQLTLWRFHSVTPRGFDAVDISPVITTSYASGPDAAVHNPVQPPSDPLAAFVAVLTPEQRAVLAKLLAGAT